MFKPKNRLKCIVVSTVPVIIAALVIALLFVFTGADSKEVDQKIVVDHDGGADDAMAIFMAILYEKYFNGPKLIALTTTHGNVYEDQAYINSQRILSVAGRSNIDIFRGGNIPLIQSIPSDFFFGLDGLGDNELEDYISVEAKHQNAAVALIELSKKYEGNLIVVAIGALTNIALAIRLDPKFIQRICQLYVGAGNIYSEKYKEAEFNAAMDAEAYRIVATSGRPEKITIVPFSQIMTYQNISKDWRMNVLGQIQTPMMQMQNSFERISLLNSTYWCLLDPAAMGIVLQESSIVEEAIYADSSIELCDENRGVTTFNVNTNQTTARVIYKVNKEPYLQLLYDLFSAELQNN